MNRIVTMNDIRLLRHRIHEFQKGTVIPRSKGLVLEVGCDYPGGSPYPDLYIDMRQAINNNPNCKGYFSLDNNPAVPADFTCDVLDAANVVGEGAIDTIIMLEVIEHAWRFWDIPEVLHKVLNEDGMVFLSTPFNFLIHDPKPDYWRITEEGLRKIFEPYFHVDVQAYPDRVHPLHYTLVGTKKNV